MPDEKVYLNGKLVPAATATVSAFDVGMTHGAGLFETFRSYGGRVFRLEKHLERLTASASALSIPAPADWSPLIVAVPALLQANHLTDARMRLTVSAGDPRARAATDAVSAAAQADISGFPGTVLLTAAPLQVPDAAAYEPGFTVTISRFRLSSPDPTGGHKTLSYFPRLIALREAQRHGCAESLWFTTGHVLAEACLSNVFVVRDGVLHTPPLDTPVLPGITRAAIVEVASHAGIDVSESPITINDLLSAQEVFLTNAIMQVMSVTRIERHAVGDEKPGPITVQLRAGLQRLIAEELA